ncbi:MAG: M14 family metallopeptidase [Bacillota bacterium]|nr:carboxypeptidase [Candidatus Fermentithermobacillaceae bacterium]
MFSKVPITFDRYLLYEEIKQYLENVAAAYPDLCSLSSIGKSYEGRDIWLLTITAGGEAAPSEKPAIYVDANIHAGEVTGSMAALYLIDYLLGKYGTDDEVTHLLDRLTLYVLPRVNPDGAELYLTTPHMLRSSVRIWPDDGIQDLPGLHRADINGDGKILEMRIRDDNKGEWKVSSKDPRLMVPRQPGERKGPFYRIYPEGYIKDYEGEPVTVHKTPWGLDLNRNFPSNWEPGVPGGGEFPAGEPETHALVQFIVNHPNIGAIQALHTAGGFFFRNPCKYEESKMDPQDLIATKAIARQGTKVTGYPDVKSPNSSTMNEWAYEHRGIIAYTTELWNRYERAGIDLEVAREKSDPEKFPDEFEKMCLKFLEWNDRELSGKGFIDWMPFEHPQLGTVEIGGWDRKFCAQNPPPHLLEEECRRAAQWIMQHAAALPWVNITDTRVQDISGSLKKVTALIENWGYLPTSITNKAAQLKVVEKDTVELKAGPGVEITGKAKHETDFLEGYVSGAKGPAKSTVQVSWVVRVSPDHTPPPCVTVEYRSQRGGVVRKAHCLA